MNNKSALRIRGRGRPAHWTSQASGVPTRSDDLQLRRWHRAALAAEPLSATDKLSKYNIQINVPTYDVETYEKHLSHAEWTKEETDHLVELYQECNGKWAVVIDRYQHGQERTMEDLKSRFYSISAIILSIDTPITSMTASEYTLYETLSNFNARQETSRKKLAEGHLHRHQHEVDEETVLLGELQRIMLNQAKLESEREVCNGMTTCQGRLLMMISGTSPSLRSSDCQHQRLSIRNLPGADGAMAAVPHTRPHEEDTTSPSNWQPGIRRPRRWHAYLCQTSRLDGWASRRVRTAPNS